MSIRPAWAALKDCVSKRREGRKKRRRKRRRRRNRKKKKKKNDILNVKGNKSK